MTTLSGQSQNSAGKIHFTRRQFIQQSVITTAGVWLAGCQTARPRRLSANEKLDIAIIGVAHRGGANLAGVGGENIVALCDVDDKLLAAAAQKFPKAKTFVDFRRLIDERGIDAVVVSTPDHTHAVAGVMALRSGRHLYSEKPLTRTVSECRIVRDTAKKMGLVTQLGTQIHAGTNYRRVVELVKSGAIGTVGEVHVWCGVSYGGKDAPSDTPPVPPELHYDLWVGPVPFVPYSPEYVPGRWRHWWAFGQGGLGDFGCHYMDLPYWALDLKDPLAIEAEGPAVHPDSTAPWQIVRYEYPARGSQPPVKMTWYHGGKWPQQYAELLPKGDKAWKSAVLFVGSKGYLLADYGRCKLLPEDKFKDFVPPQPFIKDSVGHHKEWIEACKAGDPQMTTCNFDYSGALTETVLLGNVAYRSGSRFQWDAKNLKAINCPKADDFIQHVYRKGWRI
ncbi:MAG: Gfo/Idh/MocA family oxidoreductase [Kiritimatiellae bacterium]|nr:Gfo/Idh/MocA family oxidoreductase [Kiritimatiellia bacterium]MDD5520299.1 Gfo/Idh/MocA family oxidoreductase [Kiritimatiellia bacterium]